MKRLTRRYIIKNLDNIPISEGIPYERYYINDNLRIQNKGGIFEKEILDDNNVIINKSYITANEFNELKDKSYAEIIRESYIYLNDNRVSIKRYLGKYAGLYRVEVKFLTAEEMEDYQKEYWMGNEISDSNLAFDKYLSKLDRNEFLEEMSIYL